jgi:sugar lactone lactonase YvrE
MSVYDGRAGVPGFIDTVGGTRPAAGGFNGAFAVAYGPDGSLYAADWFNHRIQQFASDGSFVREWGNYGPQEGSLIFPRGLLVTSAGDVVVTDSENNRIDVFTPNGTFTRQVKPSAGEPLSRPHQTALDGSGGYWIADTNNSRVVHLAADGGVITTFDVSGAVALGKPEGVAVDVDGTVLVSNTQNNKVERYSTSGVLLDTVAAAGSGAGQVRRPGGLLVTGTGTARRLWIADAANDRVVVLDAAGKVASTFGTSGSGAGQLRQPRAVAVDPSDGDIAVADFGNDRLSLWDPTGKPAAQDLAAPTVDVASPAPTASVAGGSVTVTGTAADDVSVASVEVSVQRPDGSWLQDDGSWAATQQALTSTLAQPGAGKSDWSFSYVASVAGSYSVTVRATDQAGKSAEGARSFTVEPLNRQAPQTSIRTPGAGATVRVAGRRATKSVTRKGRYRVTAYSRDAVGNQDATAASQKFFVRRVRPHAARKAGLGRIVRLKGDAADDVAVGVVLLSVRNLRTRKWLQVDGTFGQEPATVAADLDVPQTRSTRWSYAFSTRN